MNNYEAERLVLGAVMNDNDQLADVESQLQPDAFYTADHVKIYESMIALAGRGEVIDYFTVSDELKKVGLNDMFPYLTQMYRDYGKKDINYLMNNVHKVKSCKISRNLSNELEKSLLTLSASGGDIQEKISNILLNINSLDTDLSGKELNSIHVVDAYKNWVDLHEERINNPDQRGLTTGIAPLDEIIGYRGIQGGDLVVIAARPKSYKTATMTKISNHIGLDLKKPVLTFSLEMQNNQMMERMLTQDTGINGASFHTAMENSEYAKVNDTAVRMQESEMYIDDRSNLSMKQIQREVRGRAKALGGYGSIGAIMVDYFTLMNLAENKSNPSFAYAQMSKELVALGKEVNAPIFLLSQLNRKCEERNDKRPLVSDLGDTDQLGRDASLIVMLYNDSVYNKDSNMTGILEIIVAANRHGATGTAYQTTTNGRLGDIGIDEIGRRIAEADYQSGQGDKPYSRKV